MNNWKVKLSTAPDGKVLLEITLNGETISSLHPDRAAALAASAAAGYPFPPEFEARSDHTMKTAATVEQLKRDMDSGVMICRASWRELLDSLSVTTIEEVEEQIAPTKPGEVN